MKFAILAVIFLAVGCGKYKVGSEGNSIGELKFLSSEPISSSDRSQLTIVCNSLKADATQVEGSSHSFMAIQNDCGRPETSVTDAPVIQTKIQGGVFKNVGTGLDFLFPTFESKSSGVMADICQNLAALTTTRSFPSGEVQRVTTTGISRENCPNADGEICVQIETGTQQENGYVVHTEEFIRFKTDPNISKQGFWSYRKKVSRSFCNEEEVVITKAQLK